MPPPARSRSGVKQGSAARLFGYDVFISFALGAPPRGSRSYASDLARRLRERDCTVFFSEDEAPAGGQLDDALKTALRRSRILVVVANRGTLADPRWVRVEVEEFRRVHPSRPVIPVSIDGALQDSVLGPAAQPWLQFADRIWVDDTAVALEQGIASDDTVNRLVTAPTAVRASTRWRWTVRVAFAVLASLTVAALGFAWSDRRNAALAQTNERQAVANAVRASTNAGEARRNQVQAESNAASAVRESVRAGKAEAEAVREAEAARAAERRALAGRLAAESQLARVSDSRLALLLAREAWSTDRTPEARRALFAALDEPVPLPVAQGLGYLRRVVRSADGLFIAASAPGPTVHLWRFDPTGLTPPIASTFALASDVRDLAFSPDGHRLATIDGKVGLQFWDAERGTALGAPLHDPAGGQAWALAWDPAGRIVAVGSIDGGGHQSYVFWDVTRRQPVGEPLRTDENYGIFKVAFSPRGERFAATVNGLLFVWDLKTRQLVVPPIKSRPATRFVAFTDEDRVVFDGPGYEATAWNLSDNRGEMPTYGHTNWVAAFAHARSAGIVATGSDDRSIRLWRADVALPLRAPLVLHEYGVIGLAFSPDAHELVSAGYEGRVVRWLLDTGSHRYRDAGWHAVDRGGADLTLSDDLRWAVTLAQDGRLAWRDARTGATQAADAPAKDAQEALAVARNGTLALRLRDDRIAIHPRGQGRARCATDKAATTVRFSSDGRWFATTQPQDAAVRIWRVEDCRAAGVVARDGEDVYFRPFAFASGERSLWVADNDAIRRWDIDRGRFDPGPLIAAPKAGMLAVDPRGRFLAVGASAGLTTLIDLAAGGRATTLAGPHGQTSVRAAAFSPDGAWLATAADDGRAALWDLDARQPAGAPIDSGQGQLRRIAFSADSQRLLTGGTDGPETVAWTVDADVWAERACATAQRNLSCAEWRRVMGADLPYRRSCAAWPLPNDAKACNAR